MQREKQIHQNKIKYQEIIILELKMKIGKNFCFFFIISLIEVLQDDVDHLLYYYQKVIYIFLQKKDS